MVRNGRRNVHRLKRYRCVKMVLCAIKMGVFVNTGYVYLHMVISWFQLFVHSTSSMTSLCQQYELLAAIVNSYARSTSFSVTLQNRTDL